MAGRQPCLFDKPLFLYLLYFNKRSLPIVLFSVFAQQPLHDHEKKGEMMKKFLLFVGVICFAFALMGCGQEEEAKQPDQEKAGKAVESATEQAQDAGGESAGAVDEGGKKAGQATEAAKEKVRQAAETAKEKASESAESAKEKAGEAVSGMKEKAGKAASAAKEEA